MNREPETAAKDAELSRLSLRIEDLVARVEQIADPGVRANMIALLQSILELHQRALARIAETLASRGESGKRIFDELAEDEIVSGVLLLYGLHPGTLEQRVRSAIAKLNEKFSTSGTHVDLASIENGAVRIRVRAKESGCRSDEALSRAIEETILAEAPDAAQVRIENAPARGELVQLQIGAAAR